MTEGKEQVLRFSVGLGDWSDDGHGKFSWEEVELYSSGSEPLTPELIRENYLRNRTRLGFGLPELWEDYMQSSPREPQLAALQRELGVLYYASAPAGTISRSDYSLSFTPLNDLHGGVDGLPKNGFVLEFYQGSAVLSPFSYEDLDLAMFIVLAGLEAVSWRKVKPAPPLFGFGSSLLTDNGAVGYGLFVGG